MEEQKNVFSDFGEDLIDLTDSWYKLTILQGTRKITQLIAFILTIVTVILIGLFVLFFLGVGIAVWLGKVLNSPSAGYILVAFFYLISMMLIVAMRNRIVFPWIRDAIIKRIYDQNKSA